MQNNSVNIGGNVIGTVVTGNKSGTITTRINSANIKDTSSSVVSDQKSLGELLQELRKIIEIEKNIHSDDKSDLMEQVEALSGAAQLVEKDKKEGIVRKAKKMFEATLNNIPKTVTCVESINKLLQMIMRLL